MTRRVLLSLAAVACLGVASRDIEIEAQNVPARSIAGEVRAFAIDPSDQRVLGQLHRAGWLEASGQQLSIQDFSDAYKMIGRSWSTDNVPRDKFALPDLRHLSLSRAKLGDVTSGLLGGDVVTGGRTLEPDVRLKPLVYCVYVAADVSELNSRTGRLRPASR